MQAASGLSMLRQRNASINLQSESGLAAQHMQASSDPPDPDSSDWSWAADINAIDGDGSSDVELYPCQTERVAALEDVARLSQPSRSHSFVSTSPVSQLPGPFEVLTRHHSQVIEATGELERMRLESIQHRKKHRELHSALSECHALSAGLLRSDVEHAIDPFETTQLHHRVQGYMTELRECGENLEEVETRIVALEWKLCQGVADFATAAQHWTRFSRTSRQDESVNRENGLGHTRVPSMSLRTASPPIPESLQHYYDMAGEVGWRLERLNNEKIDYRLACETRAFQLDRGDQLEPAEDTFHADHLLGIQQATEAYQCAVEERDAAKAACVREGIDPDHHHKSKGSTRASTSRQAESSTIELPHPRASSEYQHYDTAPQGAAAITSLSQLAVPGSALPNGKVHDTEHPISRIEEWMNGTGLSQDSTHKQRETLYGGKAEKSNTDVKMAVDPSDGSVQMPTRDIHLGAFAIPTSPARYVRSHSDSELGSLHLRSDSVLASGNRIEAFSPRVRSGDSNVPWKD